MKSPLLLADRAPDRRVKPVVPGCGTGTPIRAERESAYNPGWARLALTVQPKLEIGAPDDPFEREADEVAERVMRMPEPRLQRKCEACEEEEEEDKLQRKESGLPPATTTAAPPVVHQALGSPGQSLDRSTRAFFEPRFGRDFGQVRIHTGAQVASVAKGINARAFTVGRDIAFNEGEYRPERREGRRLLAHELTHVLQSRTLSRSFLWRETAQQVISRHEDWGGLNLNEEALAEELVGMARVGRYSFIIEIINALDWSDRDDVSGEMMASFSTLELIRMARNADAVAMLRRMREELGDWWGWVTGGERHQVHLLGAVINEPGERNAWNWERIETLKAGAGTDLEALAQLFEDDHIIDDGTVSSRLEAILGATAHIVISGLQTGIEFADTGFAGEPTPGGPGFRDPHPSSRNQVGHFLTAAGLQFSPGTVSRPIPVFGSIRGMVGAPAAMSDREVAVRLTIGHEKTPDPIGAWGIVTNILLRGFIERLLPGPEGETEEERDERVGRAIEAETRHQIAEVIAAFRTQFEAATDDDLAAWNEALSALGSGPTLNMGAAEAPLSRIPIDPARRGNSIQDLRLSLVGWRLGQMISEGQFASRSAVAAWIRANLGVSASP